jgi:hypothetical protein
VRSAVGWIRRHQLISFFALVYLISFGIGIGGVYAFKGAHPVRRTAQFFVVRLLLFGPAGFAVIYDRMWRLIPQDAASNRIESGATV